MSKHYLVTGGTGFLGSALVRQLVAGGHRVRVLDNNSRGNARRLADVGNSIELVTADIRDSDAVARACLGVDSVCHLAYVNGTEFFYSKPDIVLDVAIRGMLAVMDGCRRHGVGELVLASSSEAYQSPPAVPTSENVPLVVPDVLNPRFSYGGGKLACELMALHQAAVFVPRVLVFRPHNVYGPDMGGEHVIPQMTTRLATLVRHQRGGTIDFPIQGDGSETRAFTYVDDFIAGVQCVLNRGAHRNVYHIGVEAETSIATLANAIALEMNQRINIVPGPAPAGGTSRRCPDTGKLRALGFQPRVTLQAGLTRTVPWYVKAAANIAA